MRAAVLAVIASLVLLGACGNEYDNIRDAAIEMAKATCERAAECGELDNGDVDRCVDEFVGWICDSNDCSAKPHVSNDEIDDCVDALREMSCTSPITPAECQI